MEFLSAIFPAVKRSLAFNKRPDVRRCLAWIFAAVAVLMLAVLPARADLPSYEPGQEPLSGTIRVTGSDTLGEVMMAWAEAFRALHPDVDFAIESEGSNTAPPALTGGRSDLAPMSRKMTRGEISAFRNAFDYRPTVITVALDALAVYVHKDNPIKGLTMEQLDQVFSSTHLCGGRDITRWDQLAIGSTLGPITLHSRDERSGTYDFFKETALCDGDFKPETTLHVDSRAVVDAVSSDETAIGYAGLGYSRDQVRALAIGTGHGFEDTRYYPIVLDRFKDSDDPAKRYAYVVDGRYPLSRPLLFYINKKPGEALAPEQEAFLRFVLSAQGQDIVYKAGFVPMPEGLVRDESRKLAPNYRPRRWWFFN